MIKAILFDFDGTMIDTETPWYEAYQELYREKGLELRPELYAKCIGTFHDEFDPLTYLEQQTGEPLDRAWAERELQRKHHERMIDSELRPGVEKALHSARKHGLHIGLATSSYLAWIQQYLDRHALISWFDTICTADLVEKVKPDPALYLLAAERLHVTPGECVAIEDSPNGLNAARAAGCRTVIVPNPVTAPLSFGPHDIRLNSLDEMPLEALLKELG